MYINSILSSRGAWKKLEENYRNVLDDIYSVLKKIDIELLRTQGVTKYALPPSSHLRQKNANFNSEMNVKIVPTISINHFVTTLRNEFVAKDWQAGTRHPRIGRHRTQFEFIDVTKDRVGLDIQLEKLQFAESKLFVSFPYLLEMNSLEIALMLVPTSRISRRLPRGVCNFERIEDSLVDLGTALSKYPFAILGFSDLETDLNVRELTSPIDQYLLEEIGFTLEQICVRNESEQYEFKIELPNNKKLAEEICAFANYKNGGMILVGIDKHGVVHGIKAGDNLDDLQLRVINVIRDNVTPVPKLTFHVFENYPENGMAILIIQTHEAVRKPCMTNDRVYIRSGPSGRPAKPDEIRSMIIG